MNNNMPRNTVGLPQFIRSASKKILIILKLLWSIDGSFENIAVQFVHFFRIF